MRRAAPAVVEVFKKALRTPGLKVVFGTDAVAGAHGRNFEELIFRVEQGGQDPMAALVSATSLAAASLGLEATIGALAPGLEADVIAVDGDPLDRHHGAPARRLRDEGRADLQERDRAGPIIDP